MSSFGDYCSCKKVQEEDRVGLRGAGKSKDPIRSQGKDVENELHKQADG